MRVACSDIFATSIVNIEKIENISTENISKKYEREIRMRTMYVINHTKMKTIGN